MKKIVIVDDEIDYTEILKDFCEMSNMEVVGVGHNGQDAVNLCKEHLPDFLLLDLSMPEVDGFFALENIKKLDVNVKIIILTGLLTESSIKNLEKYEVFETLIKPVDPNTVIEKINSV